MASWSYDAKVLSFGMYDVTDLRVPYGFVSQDDSCVAQESRILDFPFGFLN